MPFPLAQQPGSHDEYIYDPTNTYTTRLESPTLDHLNLPIIGHAGKRARRLNRQVHAAVATCLYRHVTLLSCFDACMVG